MATIRMRRGGAILCVASLVLAATGGAAAASALDGAAADDELPAAQPFTPFERADPAVLQPGFAATELDLHAQLARQHGVLPAAVTDEQGQALRLGALAAQIELDFPGALLHARWVLPWDGDEAPGGMLVFASPVPPGASELASRSGLPVRLLAVDAPLLDESIVAVEAMVRDLISMGFSDDLRGEFSIDRASYVLHTGGAVPSAEALRAVSGPAGHHPVVAEWAPLEEAVAE